MGIQDVAGVARATYSMNLTSTTSKETSKEENLDREAFSSNGVSGMMAVQKAFITAAREGEHVDLDSCKVDDSFLSTSVAVERINFISRSILVHAQNAIKAQTTNLTAQMVSTLEA